MITLDNFTLIPFYELSLEEKLMVLEWRNSENIRIWMYNSSKIDESDHLNFINSLENNLVKQFFLVKDNKNNLGVIYFTNINKEKKSTEFGIYTNPNSKGLGTLLMKVVLRYSFDFLRVKRVIAEVFSDNEKAVHLYEKIFFKRTSFKKVNNRNVFIMELENENR